MEKMYGKYAIINDEIINANEYENKSGQVAIYEVVRARNGHLSFLKEHYDRFLNGMKKFSMPIISFEEFRDTLYELLEINGIKDHNTKIIYDKDEKGEYRLLAFLSKSQFPTKRDYEEGVRASILYIEREDPNLKTIREDYIKRLDENLKENNSFEAIIVDRNNIVKEGGRSNFFMIKDDKLYTASSDDVLMGIIRSKVYEICYKFNIEIIEKDIYLDELKDASALFFTGTGKDVLPIRYIDDFEILSSKNQILIKIIEEFNKLAEGR